MRTTLASLVLALTVVNVSEAQTTTVRTLEYDYLNVTPAIVATWKQAVKVNGVTLATAPTCAALGVNTHCTIPLPTLNATTNNVISVTASDADESYEGVLNYNPSVTDPNSPKLPSGFNIKVTVTVVITPGQ